MGAIIINFMSSRHCAGAAIVIPLMLLAVLLPAATTSGAKQTALQPYYDLPVAQHPESVTFDPVERVFFAGSVLGKGVVKVDGVTGAVTPFIAATDLPFAAITGLRVDPDRRRLWVCNVEPLAQVAYAVGGGPAEALQSGLALFDLDTASLVSYIDLALVPGIGLPGYFCNDIAVDDVGYAYATESVRGRVIQASSNGLTARVAVSDSRLARNADEKGSLGVNGIAFSAADGNIYLTNPASGRMFRFRPDALGIPALDEVFLAEPVYGDGLIVDPRNGKAFAVSSTPDGPRVVKYIAIQRHATVKQVVTVSWPDLPRPFESPTAGTYAEGRFYIADAAFSRLQNPVADTEPGLFFGVNLP